MIPDLFPDAKRPRLDAGPSLRQTAAPPVDDALAKLRQAAQSAIDSVTMSMLGGSASTGSTPAAPTAPSPMRPLGSAPTVNPSMSTPKLPATGTPVAATVFSGGTSMGMPAMPTTTVPSVPTVPTTPVPPVPRSASLGAVPATNGCAGPAGPGAMGMIGQPGAPSPLVPPGVLAELAQRPKAQPAPQMAPPLGTVTAQVQAMAAGKLSAIEAMAGIEAPHFVPVPEIPKLPMTPQVDAFGATCAGAMPPQPPAEGGDNQTAAHMYMLAQLAEESAQTAASAAACLHGAESDTNQVAALAEAAQQAAARATWAATSLATCFPEPLPGQPQEDEWTRSVRQVTAQASEAAEQAAISCRIQANDMVSKAATSSKSKVPCKWFLLGQCRKTVCEFSHDIQDLQPRPLHKKRAEECVYFQKGQCTRGTACPFAHGPEELAEITRIVSDLKGEKRFLRR
ncbi:unnamed protein product [Cladocopium goreaui]|uniref:3-hydroxyisobutyryl-CoA hydrolase-like protein 3, mitochondrial n=1 Tax=Cladocopium goreaui TaxID=2562237 RepID=A0A9P1GTE3_9DINO|nr:unnamed protein product [Cladocopium goreaui]|mmetsp:Transcript_70568/g.155614  ORF Transcript_70568/g.155614 Transcript_70568/m.155614 type:complete len:453 (+) Transcript_70568:135-1493(+)